MHRRIDAFVDAHAATSRSLAVLPVRFRRYGGIMLDVLHDHFLALEWERLSSLPLPAFASEVYSELEAGVSDLPEAFQARVPRMVANRWLETFGDFDTVDRVLRHISTRLRRENPLAESAAVLKPLLAPLEQEFRILLPDAVVYARSLEPGAAWSSR